MKFLEKVNRVTGRASLKIRKKSPEILLVVGIAGFVGTVVTACKATLEADDILEEHAENMEKIWKAAEVNEDYAENKVKKEKTIAYTKTAVKFAKLYGPSVALGTVSVACILTSRHIMQKRYLGSVAAFNAVSEAFQTYRDRVREEEGEMKDRHYRYGTEVEETTEQVEDPETGKKKKEKVTNENFDPIKKMPSDTAVYFDESNPNWDKNPSFSMMFLRAQQNIANDILQSRGHIFLNEVYEMLGFPHTQAGSVLGWVKGLGDNYVDFGLYDIERDESRRFVNGESNIFLLDFNHDGVIWDKI